MTDISDLIQGTIEALVSIRRDIYHDYPHDDLSQYQKALLVSALIHIDDAKGCLEELEKETSKREEKMK